MQSLAGAEEQRLKGLSSAEVAERVRSGLVNASGVHTSRPWTAILRANVLTRFNALLGGLLVVILVVGPLQDALFGIILVVNTAIGVVQEVRARRTLDHLALVNEPTARVWRDGELVEVRRDDVVLDDLLHLGRGEQIVADGSVVDAAGLEVDESLLTGEAEPVAKRYGDPVRSGSVVVAGHGAMRATGVGENAFAQSLAAEARAFSLVHSELQSANNRILQVITWGIVPIAALLCWSQLSGTIGVADALRGSVAGIANMIPEGLVLLTSLAYGMGAVRLARRKVLIRELAAVEGLARVDVLCIDKTGTLTTGELEPVALEPVGATTASSPRLAEIVAGLAAAEDNPSPSLVALARLDPTALVPGTSAHVPFSSERRWSAGSFAGLGTFVLGAPEALLAGSGDEALGRRVADETAKGRRVLLLAETPALPSGRLPAELRPVGIGILSEVVRPDAAETLGYLRAQGVAVKVISGDNPRTVAAVAARAGVEDATAIDASDLPDEPDALAPVVEAGTVFGRVGPRQKRAMVAALQANGHVVAMTGDGVNDVLALRDSDLGIAMGSGSAASRSAGELVLLDDAFSRLPHVLGEGRRVLANVERVSKLFLTKTVYATILAVAIGVSGLPYPFYPRHFTVVSSLTIGIPAFFLALAPATTRLRSGYLSRVMSFALPAGVVIAAATLTTYLLDRRQVGGTAHARTAAALVLGVAGLWVLGRLARPWNWWKVLLVAAMAGAFALAFMLPLARHLLGFSGTGAGSLTLAAVVAAGSVVALEVVWFVQSRRGRTAALSSAGG